MPKFFRSGDKSNRLSKPRKININMPQLVPFFFVNQVVFAFVILIIIFLKKQSFYLKFNYINI